MPLKDKAAKAAYEKKWYAANKDKHRVTNKNWVKNNPEAKRESDKLYRRTHPWIVSHYSAEQRCNNPKHDSYPYYGGKGIKFCLTLQDTELAWKRDGADLMKKPSIDRLDSTKDYTADNIQFIEHVINSGRTKRE